MVSVAFLFSLFCHNKTAFEPFKRQKNCFIQEIKKKCSKMKLSRMNKKENTYIVYFVLFVGLLDGAADDYRKRSSYNNLKGPHDVDLLNIVICIPIYGSRSAIFSSILLSLYFSFSLSLSNLIGKWRLSVLFDRFMCRPFVEGGIWNVFYYLDIKLGNKRKTANRIYKPDKLIWMLRFNRNTAHKSIFTAGTQKGWIIV